MDPGDLAGQGWGAGPVRTRRPVVAVAAYPGEDDRVDGDGPLHRGVDGADERIGARLREALLHVGAAARQWIRGLALNLDRVGDPCRVRPRDLLAGVDRHRAGVPARG